MIVSLYGFAVIPEVIRQFLSLFVTILYIYIYYLETMSFSLY